MKLEYYQLAIRHKSLSVPGSSGQSLSNERLEFLGDAVLNSVVTDILYHHFENKREGFLTDTRAKIVNRESLNTIALNIGLDNLLLATKYVNENTNRNIYGNALEALIGAIYLDYGYDKCREFVEKKIIKYPLDLELIIKQEINFKSKLIEWCQKNKVEVEFVLVQDILTDVNSHNFITELKINGLKICEANGRSKKESQQKASQLALDIISSSPDKVLHPDT